MFQSFISNEQIAGVLGKGKEVRVCVLCLYFFLQRVSPKGQFHVTEQSSLAAQGPVDMMVVLAYCTDT